jgi:hypothetical protein
LSVCAYVVIHSKETHDLREKVISAAANQQAGMMLKIVVWNA